jgi:uncharacterized RDD family membrane protein YckC
MQTAIVQSTSSINQAVIASIGDRILAFIIDSVILTGYTIVMGSLFFSLDIEDLLVWFIFAVIPLLFYTMIFEISMDGQTPGKRAMQIRVVSSEGQDASSGQIVIRWIFLIAGFYFFSGIIATVVILANGKGQRLGDIVAGTKVVKLAYRGTVNSTVYVPTFPMARLLTPADIETVSRALNAQRDLENEVPVALVTEKMKWMLAIDTELSPSDFLSTLVKDYKHLSRS